MRSTVIRAVSMATRVAPSGTATRLSHCARLSVSSGTTAPASWPTQRANAHKVAARQGQPDQPAAQTQAQGVALELSRDIGVMRADQVQQLDHVAVD